MKKFFLGLLAAALFTFSASANTADQPSAKDAVQKGITELTQALVYPSGSGSFIDDCGNTVEFTWSCNFDCSTGQILDAISSFVGGYGCGNYSGATYYY